MRKAKIWTFLCKSISIFLSCSLFFLCLSSPLFCKELWLANFLGEEQVNIQRVVFKQRNWQWILVSVTLTGLVRISKMRYHWKDLSLKLLLFINLYPASRGPSIFLDKSGRLKRSVAWWDKTGTILEPRMNRVLKHENRVLSFEKPAFFILTTRNDFKKWFINFLEKHNNNHLHIHWMHGPTELACTIWAKLSLSF